VKEPPVTAEVVDGDPKSCFDLDDGTASVNDKAVRPRLGDCETTRPEPVDNIIMSLLGRGEPGGKLVGAQPPVVPGGGWIVLGRKDRIQARLISQRETHDKIEDEIAVSPALRSEARERRVGMVWQSN
jgi:hypothetical protein